MASVSAAGAAPALPLRSRLGTRGVYWLFTTPAVLLLAAFYFYPLLSVLWTSVTEPKPGLGNYALLATSPAIQHVLVTTARICALTTAVTILLGYAVAYALVHLSPRARRWMFLGVLLPLWISVLARAFAWVTLLRTEGLVNQLLLELDLTREPLHLMWNELGITIGMIHYMLPYAILPLYANMRGIDLRLVAAARGLGATRGQSFRHVFLPLSLPGIVGAGVLVFIFSLGFFVTPAILGGNRVLMIAQYISIQILEVVRWGIGAMMATVLMAAVLALMALLARIVDFRRLFGVG
ncbi:MAG TPA: ABC transporter permease [Alphaproteobacteria bacterium]|nr:ABC transporter permease [Alphaproteobacteria bacterium]